MQQKDKPHETNCQLKKNERAWWDRKVPWITKPGDDPKGIGGKGNQEEKQEEEETREERDAERAEVKQRREPTKKDNQIMGSN